MLSIRPRWRFRPAKYPMHLRNESGKTDSMSQKQRDASSDDEFVEIDWEPLQAALDAMADEGLDLDDTDVMRDSLSVLLASLLRKIQVKERTDDEDLGEIAAEIAALAVQIALDEEDVPAFAVSAEDD